MLFRSRITHLHGYGYVADTFLEVAQHPQYPESGAIAELLEYISHATAVLGRRHTGYDLVFIVAVTMRQMYFSHVFSSSFIYMRNPRFLFSCQVFFRFSSSSLFKTERSRSIQNCEDHNSYICENCPPHIDKSNCAKCETCKLDHKRKYDVLMYYSESLLGYLHSC